MAISNKRNPFEILLVCKNSVVDILNGVVSQCIMLLRVFSRTNQCGCPLM